MDDGFCLNDLSGYFVSFQLQRKHEEEAQNLQFQLMYGDTVKDKELTQLRTKIQALEQENAQVRVSSFG